MARLCLLRASHLREQIERADATLREVRYSSAYRPHHYAVAYTAACTTHAKAALLLAGGELWPSFWPVGRAAIEAMVWVDRIAADDMKALCEIEIAAIDSRFSWMGSATKINTGFAQIVDASETELTHQLKCLLKRSGVNAKPKTPDLVLAVDSRMAANCDSQDNWVVGYYFRAWKMFSQSAHMDGNQISNLMSDSSAETFGSVVVGKSPPDDIAVDVVNVVANALSVAVSRLEDYLRDSQVTSAGGALVIAPQRIDALNVKER